MTWTWYAGGWDDAVAGHPSEYFQFHHQPFNFFQAYAPGTPGRAHLADLGRIGKDLAEGRLPQVSFVKFLGENNEHPGYAALQKGEESVAALVQAIRDSGAWKDTVVIITHDENGGRWDHVAPPAGDEWGPGTRVPMMVVSPLAKRGFVDHTTYESLSIIRLIERRWNLAPLGERDAKAADMTNAFATAK